MDPRAYMDHAAFHVPDRLAAALRSAAAHGTPPYALLSPERPVVDDLSVLPSDATFVATRGTARGLERIGHCPALVTAWAHPVTTALVHQLARLGELRALYLGKCGRVDLAPIAACTSLLHLVIDGAPSLADLSFLAPLTRLRTLYISDARRVDLSTLPVLPRLAALHLSGGAGGTMRIESLAPLARLGTLRHLTVENIRPADGSLQPLSALARLRELHLPNTFEIEEFARLAGTLPLTRGAAMTPFYAEDIAFSGTEVLFRCEHCRRTRALMTGRPAALLCPECDADRVRRRVARWEAARGSAWPVSIRGAI